MTKVVTRGTNASGRPPGFYSRPATSVELRTLPRTRPRAESPSRQIFGDTYKLCRPFGQKRCTKAGGVLLAATQIKMLQFQLPNLVEPVRA